jgi:hypothetical protein
VIYSPERIAARAIAKENFRRYRPIGLLALVVYFMIGPLQYILIRADLGQDTARGVMTNFSTFAAAGMVFSVASAVAVFRYLHSPSAASVVRSFPVGRRTLFLSGFVSGLLLSLVPFAICALAVLPLMAGGADAGEWLTWVLAVCTTMFFTYAVSVLAGMVSGNTPVHIITALAFNFAWVFIYMLAIDQAEVFLLGMPADGDAVDAMIYFHPVLYFLSAVDVNTLTGAVATFSPAPMAVYLIAAAGISAFACFAFVRVKAERAGRAVTARPAEYVFVFVIAALGMLIGGLSIGSLDPASGSYGPTDVDLMTYVSAYHIAGAFIGAVVAFIVATMILRGSARVFDLSFLRRFAVFAALAAVFMLCTMTNITGFETRVPGQGDAVSGAFGAGRFIAPPYKYNSVESRFLESGLLPHIYIPIEGESDIEALTAFHRKALDDKAYITGTGGDDETGSQDVEVGYRLRGAGSERRSYMLSGDYLRGSNEYARLVSSDSVKNYMSIENLFGYDDLKTPDISYGEMALDATPDTDARAKLTGEALTELARRLDEDYRDMSANDMMNPGEEFFTLRLSSSRFKGEAYSSLRSALYGDHDALWTHDEPSAEFGLYYTVTEKNERAVAWLKELGVMDSLIRTADELERRYNDEMNGEEDV